jgi:hypothetical protein
MGLFHFRKKKKKEEETLHVVSIQPTVSETEKQFCQPDSYHKFTPRLFIFVNIIAYKR